MYSKEEYKPTRIYMFINDCSSVREHFQPFGESAICYTLFWSLQEEVWIFSYFSNSQVRVKKTYAFYYIKLY